MSILTTLLDKVCVLSTRSISSSKGTEILSLYTVLPNFMKIGWELFELIEWYTDTHTHTHTQTDRQIHADENNTSPKTKFLGEVKRDLYILSVYIVLIFGLCVCMPICLSVLWYTFVPEIKIFNLIWKIICFIINVHFVNK